MCAKCCDKLFVLKKVYLCCYNVFFYALYFYIAHLIIFYVQLSSSK